MFFIQLAQRDVEEAAVSDAPSPFRSWETKVPTNLTFPMRETKFKEGAVQAGNAFKLEKPGLMSLILIS